MTSLDELGPVDYVVVEFPAGCAELHRRDGRRAARPRRAGTIRVIDVLILTKNEDGSVDATELSDVPELGELEAIEAELAELLAADDVENLAAAMDPGSVAGVLIYENLWAAPFASAARRAGGQLIADGRIPIQAIIASIEADELRRRRSLTCRFAPHVSDGSASSATPSPRPPPSPPSSPPPAPPRSRRPQSSPPPSRPAAASVAAGSEAAARVPLRVTAGTASSGPLSPTLSSKWMAFCPAPEDARTILEPLAGQSGEHDDVAPLFAAVAVADVLASHHP